MLISELKKFKFKEHLTRIEEHKKGNSKNDVTIQPPNQNPIFHLKLHES